MGKSIEIVCGGCDEKFYVPFFNGEFLCPECGMNIKIKEYPIKDVELEKIRAKVNFSGYDRPDSLKIINRLLDEIERLKKDLWNRSGRK